MLTNKKWLSCLCFLGICHLTACDDTSNHGQTTCEPQCTDRVCGSDGCGGECGTCGTGYTCSDGACILNAPICEPDCTGKVCGDDGCGDTCGECDTNYLCEEGQCKIDPSTICIPSCQNKECGDNGCGGSCGSCEEGYLCKFGFCEEAIYCEPSCNGKQCGGDGCGGSCGACPTGDVCAAGSCCTPSCDGKACGSDGCGGSCGECEGADHCSNTQFVCEPWVVKGSVFYEKLNIELDETHHMPTPGDIETLPAAGLPVYLLDKNGRTKKGESIIQPDGSFSITATAPLNDTDQLVVIPAWIVNDELKLVIQKTNVTYPLPLYDFKYTLSDVAEENDYVTLKKLVITVEQGSGAINIFNTMKRAGNDLVTLKYIDSVNKLSPLAVAWQRNLYWTCRSCYFLNGNNTISSAALGYNAALTTFIGLNGMDTNYTAWNDNAILQEFGKYVLALKRGSTNQNKHQLEKAANASQAWAEGWGHFYSLVERSLINKKRVTTAWDRYNDDNIITNTWIDYDKFEDGIHTATTKATETTYADVAIALPNPESTQGQRQTVSEGWITWTLMSLWNDADYKSTADGEADPADENKIAISFEDIAKTLSSDRYIFIQNYNYFKDGSSGNRTYYGVDLVDFIDALICNEFVDQTSIFSWIKDNTTFPYDESPVCDLKETTVE